MSVKTNRSVCSACVISVLLYGSECWVPLRRYLKRLNSFHHRCLCTVLGITNQGQWEELISFSVVRKQWGNVETIETKLMRHRLDGSDTKVCLFGCACLDGVPVWMVRLFGWLCLDGFLGHGCVEVQEGDGETW